MFIKSAIALEMPFQIFHSYKVYPRELEGGVPAVIFCLTRHPPDGISHNLLTARPCGWRRTYIADGLPVEAVSSFGSLFSTPLALGYIPTFIRRVRSANLALHHAPFPLTDIAIRFGLPATVPLVICWHADVVGFPLLT